MLRTPRTPLALAIFSLISASSALADAAKTPSDIEEVLVWGTKVKVSSLAIDAGALNIKQPDHISDLLRTLPGVDVGGAHSLNQRITIRSMDDKDLRISIDGANQNTYMFHHMGNLQIHADILESVDIDVGNNSVLNGGLGGSVRFKTKEAKHLLDAGAQFGGRVQGSYADNSGDSVALTGYGQLTDTVDVLAYFNQVKRNNYDVGGGKILNQDGAEIAGTDGTVRGLEGQVEDTLIKFGWDLAAGHRLKLGYESYTDKGDYSQRPDMGLATGLAIANALKVPLVYPTEFTRDTTTLSYEAELGANTTLNAAIYSNKSTFWRDETAYTRAPTVNQGDADNTGVNLLATTKIAGGVSQVFNYGVEQIQYETAYTVDGAALASENADNTAAFIEDQVETEQGFNFIPGLRYESNDIDSTLTSKRYSAVTGALAVEYEANDNLLLRVSSTSLFKAPEIGEVFIGAGLYDLPNPNIEAETGSNSQFSIAYQAGILGADNFSTGITLFQTDIDNYIYDYAEDADGDYWKDNIGSMQIEGYEAYVGYNLNSLKLLLTYSSAESELSALPEYAVFDGARLDRQQGDSLSLSADYTFTSLNLSLHWDALWVKDVASGLDIDGATLENAKDGYAVHNLSAHWQPAAVKGLGLTLGVDNVFDEFYASQSSRTGTSFHPRFGRLYLMDYEPGRSVKLTVSYGF
jgi:hemoglobin/transferrin/lactoferrin receptor protein